ncbi:methyltransferase [Gleimia hominis]|uniref:Methyltransferase n=1 Tax=Gleimia hominis TaxID=595468 RepID=A0ABU3I980_9ACTO|nr:methyltransferase [Gleimia hominis]MDT3766935.1 methyltransferase [Gleimia hominis]
MNMTRLRIVARLLNALRADLKQLNYSHEGVRALLGADAHDALLREQRAPAIMRAGESSAPLAYAIRLLLLGADVAAVDVDRAFTRTGTEGLCRLGLVNEPVHGRVRTRVQIQPTPAPGQHHWWVVCDMNQALTGHRPARDHVLGVGGASRTSLRATPSVPVGTVLDMGTGSGILALQATTHAKRVVATDLSKRACEFAAFNAALNDVPVEVRRGSLFEPVCDERFDLIVSNPPFVITPQELRAGGLVEYRDGGRTGDALTGEVLRQATKFLNPGGRAIILGNWEIQRDRDWAEHPRKWLANTGVHAMVIEREQLSPVEYAHMWLRDNGQDLGPRSQYESDYCTWLRDFDRRDVQAVGMGIVLLVKPGKAGAEPLQEPVQDVSESGSLEGAHMSGSAGRVHQQFEQVRAPGHATGSYLQAIMDELASNGFEVRETDRFVRTSDVREERHYLPGEENPQVIVATQGDGFGQRIRLHAYTAGFLGACDGELTVGQICTAISVLMDAELEQVWSVVKPQIRQLLTAGMITRQG